MKNLEHIRYDKLNTFLLRLSKFLKALKWNQKHMAYAEKHKEKFAEQIMNPMDESWEILTTEEQDYFFKNIPDDNMSVKDIEPILNGTKVLSV